VEGLPRFELTGARDAPLVVVLGGLSASSHIAATAADPASGWWDAIVGAGRAVDTRRFRTLGVEFLDGGRRADGRPCRIVTTHDQADAVASVLEAVEVERVHAVIGASYGGMVALAFAERHPGRLERLVAISAAHESHPMSTALRSLQRRIVRLGIDTGQPRAGLALARGLAMTSYRSAREFAERFAVEPIERSTDDALFAVERYLCQLGERFALRWTPERFLALSLSADLHRVDPAGVTSPTLLVAAEGDMIVPREQLEQLAARIAAPCRLADLPSIRGHDAFLTEPERLGPLLSETLTKSILS
jgi:homoserine O-acetyltransferase/O-succinyltransferase